MSHGTRGKNLEWGWFKKFEGNFTSQVLQETLCTAYFLSFLVGFTISYQLFKYR